MQKQLTVLFLLVVNIVFAQQKINIIPMPVSVETEKGSFVIDETTALSYKSNNKDLSAAAAFFKAHIKRISDINLNEKEADKKKIELMITAVDKIGDEGYLLNVSPSLISIKANSHAGIIYGMQSLFQTLPAIRTNTLLEIPCMKIVDYPRFKWRGMHLDVSRHFFGPEFVKQYIDLLASYKMNRFHWHLVDDQGWRIEIKKYPKLTSTGAWRVDRMDDMWNTRKPAKPGEVATYGGYYTQEQIRDIINYAEARAVTIVPEIEMPGHVASAIASYNWLSCAQLPQLLHTGPNNPGASSNYCAGNDSVFHFLEDVLTEVMALFPSEYIHIGGDEVDKKDWKNCVRCQARIKKEGLKNEEELQSYFVRRIEKLIVSKGIMSK